MPTVSVCPACKVRIRVSPELAGKNVRCPKCQRVFVVPSSEVAVNDVAAQTATATASPKSSDPAATAIAAGPLPLSPGPNADTGKKSSPNKKSAGTGQKASPSGRRVVLLGLAACGFLGLLCAGGFGAAYDFLNSFGDAVHIAQVEEPPKAKAAPGKPAPIEIKPPAMDQDKVVCELGDTLDQLCIGGEGRYILMRLMQSRKIALFDVNVAKVVHEFPVERDNVRIAASREKLVVVYKDVNRIERWSLITREKEFSRPIDDVGNIQTLAMGCASDGPLLVGCGADFSLFGLESLAPLRPDKIEAGWQGGREVQYRASADGKVFGAWNRSVDPSGLRTFVFDGRQLKTAYEHSRVGHVAPSADGQIFFTRSGLYNRDLKPAGFNFTRDRWSGTFCIPAVRGNYYLGIDWQPFKPAPISVFMPGDSRPVITLTNIMVDDAAADNDSVGPDRRYLFIPDAKVLITIPPPNHKLVIHRLDIDDALQKTGRDYLFVTSAPPVTAARGEDYQYKIAVKSKHGGVQFKLDTGPDGMKIDADGELRWQAPKEMADARKFVRVIIKDRSGQEIEHAFQLGVGVPGLVVASADDPFNERKDVVKEKNPVAPAAKVELPPAPPPLPIETPKFSEDRIRHDLGDAVRDVAVGGGGRFLLLHLPTKRQIALFDVNAASIVHHFPADGEQVLFAAGMNKLVIVFPATRTIERWNLVSREREITTTIPQLNEIGQAVMGSASQGPLLLAGSKDKREGGDSIFLDLQTFRPMKFTTQGFGNIDFSGMHVRASADGRVFGAWGRNVQSGLRTAVLQEDGQLLGHQVAPAFGLLVPGPDSKMFFTRGDIVGRDLKPLDALKDNEFRKCRLPSVHGDYGLQITFPEAEVGPNKKRADHISVKVRRVGEKNVLREFKDLDLGYWEIKAGADPKRDALSLDKRVFLIPQAKVIVTIPTSNDHLVVRRFEADKPAPDPNPIADNNAAPRQVAFDKEGTFRMRDQLTAQDPREADSKLGPFKTYLIPKISESYVLEAQSKEFVCCLSLYDAEGKFLRQDTNKGGIRNARLIIDATEKGPFRVHASSVNGKTGPFAISIREINAPYSFDVKQPLKVEKMPYDKASIVECHLNARTDRFAHAFIWTPDGAGFCYLANDGTLRRVRVPDFVEERHLVIGKDGKDGLLRGRLQMTASGLIYTRSDLGQFWLVDPHNLHVLHRFSDFRGGNTISHPAQSAFYVPVVSAKSRTGLYRYDLTQPFEPPVLLEHAAGIRLMELSPDGRYLIGATKDKRLARWKIDGNRLVEEEAGDVYDPSWLGRPGVSPDQKHVFRTYDNNPPGLAPAPRSGNGFIAYRFGDLSKPAFAVDTGSKTYDVHADPKSGHFYAYSRSKGLVVADGEGKLVHELSWLKPPAYKDDLLVYLSVHPDGGKLLALYEPHRVARLFYVELPPDRPEPKVGKEEKTEPQMVVFDDSGVFRKDDRIGAGDPRAEQGGRYRTFIVPLEAGYGYTFEQTSADVVCRLTLFDPQGKKIVEDREGSKDLTARILFNAVAAGQYQLQASHVGDTIGAYTLELKRFKLPVPDPVKKALKTEKKQQGGCATVAAEIGRAPFNIHLGSVDWGVDGKCIFVLEDGWLRRISVPEFVEETRLSVGNDAAHVRVCAEGVLVSQPKMRELWLIDPQDMTIRKRHHFFNKRQPIFTSPSLNVVFSQFPGFHKNGKSRLAELGDKKPDGEPVMIMFSYDLAKPGQVGTTTVPAIFLLHAVTPDGRFVLGRTPDKKMFRFKTKNLNLAEPEVGGSLLNYTYTTATLFASADSQWFLRRLSTAPEDAELAPGVKHGFAAFRVTDLTRPVFAIDTETPPLTAGFDPKTGNIYAPSAAKGILVCDPKGKVLKELPLEKGGPPIWHLLVHPDGGKLLVFTGKVFSSTVLYIELPEDLLPAKNRDKKSARLTPAEAPGAPDLRPFYFGVCLPLATLEFPCAFA